jgi:transcriptional regulator with GAF, ATPase, and Fis domain
MSKSALPPLDLPARVSYRTSRPTQEFLELLAFDVDEALIWLGDRRMMMIEVPFFAELRRNVIDALGPHQANRVFARIGFESAVRDAKLMLERFPAARNDMNLARLSPHRFQGFTNLVVLSMTRAEDGRILHGEYQWEHSVEADAHVAAYGRATAPTCWMEIGYGTGYRYVLGEQIVLFREVGCRAMGNRVCTITGRAAAPGDDLDEVLKNLEFLKPLVEQEIARTSGASAPASAPRSAPREPLVVSDAPSAEPSAEPSGAGGIDGASPALKVAKQLLQSVSSTDATVLISGESGVGKELFAKHLHLLSRRADKPLVAVNCAAIPETLIEAELFGVERGAFTGATESRAGRFERAQGGTLFFDEIGSLNAAAQVKLLRAIQEREIERVGGTKPIKLDVRIVAANNVPLRELVARNEFREDLFYRLNVFPIHVPPLRERREDIPDLMRHYLQWYNRVHGRAIKSFTFEATKALLHYHYPGNIRELQNLIERAVILTEGDAIDVYNLFAYGETLMVPSWTFDASGTLRADDRKNAVSRRVAEFGDELLELSETNETLSWPDLEDQLFTAITSKVLAEARGNVSSAARRLGMQRHQLEYRLKRSTASAPEPAADGTPAAGG